jgi:tripartite-type tricarboxylate transporter receptor subunit TctC
MRRHCTGGIAVGLLMAGTVPATTASAETVEQFYKGKTISAIVPFAPGGGYAIYTQIMARHLPKHIPGQPTIVPQYMPGAGGIVASNHVYNLAKRDGTVLATVSDSVALASVIDADKIKYKVNEFIWIGAVERVNNVLAVRTDSGVRSLDDMTSTETVLGASGPGSPTSLLPRLLAWLGPYKVKTVEGYRGINPMFTAIERKEISGMTVSWTIFKSLKGDWFKTGFLTPIVQFGARKEPDLANVPLAFDLAKTAEQKAVARFMASNVDVGRSFILPPQVPADRVAALRAAFDKMVRDNDFKAELAKAGFELSPATGQEVQAAVAEATKLDAAQADRIRATFTVTAKPAKK